MPLNQIVFFRIQFARFLQYVVGDADLADVVQRGGLFEQFDLIGGEARTSIETTDVDFFAADALPDLSVGRVLDYQIARMFEHRRNPDLPTDFD